MIAKRWPVKQLLSPIRRYRRVQAIRAAKQVILGAGPTSQPGWFATDVADLDIRREASFRRYWGPDSRTAFVAEHVWEHLTPDEGKQAIENCYKFLSKGGRLRIAVPDGASPDPAYIAHVEPGGVGPGADDHKVLYTAPVLEAALSDAGFRPAPLEYFDASGVFHAHPWRVEDGFIIRSRQFDRRNSDGVLRYTSLIVDGIK